MSSLESWIEQFAAELINDPALGELPLVQQIQSHIQTHGGPSEFAKEVASSASGYFERLRQASGLATTAEVQRLEEEFDDLAEFIDRFAQRVEPTESPPGLPASQPLQKDLAELFIILVGGLLSDGLDEEQARAFFARARRSPHDGPGARQARRHLLRARRTFGHAVVVAAERMITVPVVFSVIYAAAQREAASIERARMRD